MLLVYGTVKNHNGDMGTISIILIASLLTLSSCKTLQDIAINSVANILSSPEGTNTFTSDNDPELVGDSFPLALKLYEIVLERDPENSELAAVTGRNFVMYSGAFVHMPSDMLDDTFWKEADAARKRAKKLYLRGRDYLMRALYLRHSEFEELLEEKKYDDAIALLNEDDAEIAYWAGLAWLGMASTDPLDMELISTLDIAVLLLLGSMKLNEADFRIQDVMIQINLTLPSSILVNLRNRSPHMASYMDEYYSAAGIDENPVNRAFFHYNRALELSKGLEPSPHITMATALSIKEQDIDGFRRYLEAALAIKPDANPDFRLMVIIYQERARWLLDNVENFFI